MVVLVEHEEVDEVRLTLGLILVRVTSGSSTFGEIVVRLLLPWKGSLKLELSSGSADDAPESLGELGLFSSFFTVTLLLLLLLLHKLLRKLAGRNPFGSKLGDVLLLLPLLLVLLLLLLPVSLLLLVKLLLLLLFLWACCSWSRQ